MESATVAGRWLQPRGVIYYGYFEDAGAPRRALALSSIPTFPDVGATLLLDERPMALLLASRADETSPARGFVPAGTDLNLQREQVVKWGNRHCGDDKARINGASRVATDAIVEPFVAGRSERVLLIGDQLWHLRYESTDWRKNVAATVTTIEPEPLLVARARRTAERLGLSVAGVDYIVNDGGATLLEVNAYPGFDDADGAPEAFVSLAAAWWRRVSSSS